MTRAIFCFLFSVSSVLSVSSVFSVSPVSSVVSLFHIAPWPCTFKY